MIHITDEKLTFSSGVNAGDSLLPNEVTNARVSASLREPAKLSFDSAKRDLFEDPTVRITVGDREFYTVRIGPGVRVKMLETWNLLDMAYATVGKTPYAVMLVHASVKPALRLLLEGSGWAETSSDVSGVVSLECGKLYTDLTSLLVNLREIERQTEGWLVFDSVNKTVSLRRDDQWQDDSGIQLRYTKDGKDLEKTIDLGGIVTRLVPWGKLLENHSYTTEIREGTFPRTDFDDSIYRDSAAKRYLAKVCRPQVQYQGTFDLRNAKGYNDHKRLSIGDMVTIHDESLPQPVKVRLISLSYDVASPWMCDLTLGDLIEDGLRI